MSDVYHSPSMEFDIKLNKKTPASDVASRRVSFKQNYNQIDITYKCTNQSINNYQIWVTQASEENWGLNIGVKAYENTSSLAANTERVANILANNTIFSHGDGVYRLALCARGDIDMTWDVTEVLIVVSGLIWKPTDASAVEMMVSDLAGQI